MLGAGEEGASVSFSVPTSRTVLHLHQVTESNSFGIKPFVKVGRHASAARPPAAGCCSAPPLSPLVRGQVGVLGCWATRDGAAVPGA